MLFKIIGIGLTTVILNLILRQYKSDFAFLVNVCIEVKDDDSNTHTLSLSVLTKILYVSVRFLRLLPELEVDPKLVGEKNWFKLAFKRFSKHPKKSNLLMSSRYFSAEQTTLPLVSSEDFSVKDWNYV